MAHRTRSAPSETVPIAPRSPDLELVDLVDALVAAVDASRSSEIDQLRMALEPFGATILFDAELRLNGTPSVPEFCLCGGDEL